MELLDVFPIFFIILECEEYQKLTEKKIVINTLILRPSDHEITSTKCNQGVSLITGGEEAESAEFPHMAAIGWKEFERTVFACGGSLISEQFVLTVGNS